MLACPVTRLSPNRRITGCLRIYYCYYYFVSLRPPLPPRSLPPHLFFFLHSFATVAKRREAVRRRDAIRRVAARMWKYDGNISLFAALARPDDSVAVPRHEAFISRYVYIHRYVQAPGSSLNKCRSIYKGGEMRIFPSPFPFLRCSSSCCSSSKSSLFLYLSLSRFVSCPDIAKRLTLFFQGEYEDNCNCKFRFWF